MAVVTMKELLETGVHFGHQTKRWNPRMKQYIYGVRNGIYIIDLMKTLKKFKEAYRFVRDAVSDGGTVLFVGTKKQAQNVIFEESQRCGMYYVNFRWLGGMLTNFSTIQNSIRKLEELELLLSESAESLTKKEYMRHAKEKEKLERNLSGIRTMTKLPVAVFVIDPQMERIAVNEAAKLHIPVVGIVDTNCDPSKVDYVIPGNDDAIRAIKLITSRIADAVIEGQHLYQSRLTRDVEVKPQSNVARDFDKKPAPPPAPPVEKKPKTAPIDDLTFDDDWDDERA